VVAGLVAAASVASASVAIAYIVVGLTLGYGAALLGIRLGNWGAA
jgi:hypothetical protein